MTHCASPSLDGLSVAQRMTRSNLRIKVTKKTLKAVMQGGAVGPSGSPPVPSTKRQYTALKAILKKCRAEADYNEVLRQHTVALITASGGEVPDAMRVPAAGVALASSGAASSAGGGGDGGGNKPLLVVPPAVLEMDQTTVLQSCCAALLVRHQERVVSMLGDKEVRALPVEECWTALCSGGLCHRQASNTER